VSDFVTSVEVSAATGAFDAIIYRDQGDYFSGYYINQQNVNFLFRFYKWFAQGVEEVDNTVHLDPAAYEKLKEENPELLEKLAHTIPHRFIEEAAAKSCFSYDLRPEFVLDGEGARLPQPIRIEEEAFLELKQEADDFIGQWLWYAADQPEQISEFIRQAEKQEWREYPVNIRPALRVKMRLHGGIEDGTVASYRFGPETEQLSTDDVDQYNILNLLVEIRHVAQKIYTHWH